MTNIEICIRRYPGSFEGHHFMAEALGKRVHGDNFEEVLRLILEAIGEKK